MSLKAGESLEQRYLIAERLGSGSLVQTYAATRLSDHLPVVIKQLSFADLEHWKPFDLFKRESEVLASLQHPAIPRLIEAFELSDPGSELYFYLVLERLPGQNLAHKLAQGWRPELDQVKQLALQLLNVLSYLHQLYPPVLHRDLKPSNLLIDGDRLYLVDFGAVQQAVIPSGSSTIVGTYGYMAPEQLSGRASPATDLYALGATLVHLISGRSPTELPQRELKLQFNQYVSDFEFCAWLERLLEPIAEHRFQQAEVARAALLNPPVILSKPIALPRPAQTRVIVRASAEGLSVYIPPGDFAVMTLYQTFLLALLVSSLPFIFVMAGMRLGLIGFVLAMPSVIVAWLLAKQTLLSLFGSRSLLLTTQSIQIKRSLSLLYQEGQRYPLSDLQVISTNQHAGQASLLLRVKAAKSPLLRSLGLSPAEQLWLESLLLVYLADVLSPNDYRRLMVGDRGSESQQITD